MSLQYDKNGGDAMYFDQIDNKDYSGDISGIEGESSIKAASFIPVVTQLIGMGSEQIDKNELHGKRLKQMDNEVESFRFSQNRREEDLLEINRAAADVMTERGIKTMVQEASLRAGAAETGTTGGTTETSINDAYMQEMLDNALILRERDKSKVSIFRDAAAHRRGISNNLSSIADGQQSAMSAGLKTANQAISGFTAGLSFLNSSELETLFHTDKGTNNANKYNNNSKKQNA